MSLARRLQGQQVHAFSRRCAGRCFYLVPDKWTRDLIGYCFALADQKYPQVAVHAFVSMSNHVEVVATDLVANILAWLRLWFSNSCDGGRRLLSFYVTPFPSRPFPPFSLSQLRTGGKSGPQTAPLRPARAKLWPESRNCYLAEGR